MKRKIYRFNVVPYVVVVNIIRGTLKENQTRVFNWSIISILFTSPRMRRIMKGRYTQWNA